MTSTAAPPAPSTDAAGDTGPDATDRRSFWRTVWRLHFYAGMLVVPVIVTLAVTGSVMLFRPEIEDIQFAHLLKVDRVDEPAPLDAQVAAARTDYPNAAVAGVTPPRSPERSTLVTITLPDASLRQVFVDPSSATVLGSLPEGAGLPALAERIHGTLLLSATVPVPTLGGVVDVEIGDLIVELVACWAIVLAVSGLYLWWPRGRRGASGVIVPRVAQGGRARWRDLHAIPNAIFAVLIVFLVLTGLPWSGFWGGNFDHVANKTSSGYNAPDPAPASAIAVAGDLDRFGNQIPWAAAGVTLPTSTAGGAHAGHEEHGGVPAPAAATPPAPTTDRPAPLDLDAVARIGRDEGMLPGYSIALPVGPNGVYSLVNPWPAKIQDERTLYLDQYSGETLLDYDAADYGVLAKATTLGIATHMGEQFGLVNTLLMLATCVVLLSAVATGIVMWWKRRPKRTLGLPRRSSERSLEAGLVVIGAVLGVIFPLLGLTLVAVLAVDLVASRWLVSRSAPRTGTG